MNLSADRDPSTTSIHLLQRVRQHEPEAWERFCAIYGPVVYGWCRKNGLQSSDAADTAQDVFQILVHKIADFRGDQDATQPGRGSFRGWLWTITRNQVRVTLRKRGQEPEALGGSSAQQRIGEQVDDAAEDGLSDALSSRQRIVQRALGNVQRDFSPQTWQIFVQTCLHSRSGVDVAAELGISENAVRQAKFRVLRRLREELVGEL